MVPAKGRLAVIAGYGRLPQHIAAAARAAGEDPFIFALAGESDQDWSAYEHVEIAISDIARFSAGARRLGIDRVVLSGGVRRRPRFGEIRPTWRSLRSLPEVFRALKGYGDDRMLRVAISMLEEEGVRVVGAHEIAPDILATPGPVGRHRPKEADRADIAAGMEAALALGRLDIGQGVISVGGRVVALEGLEGTDEMLARVAGLRAAGRLRPGPSGVLVKMCKPSQDMRADLPSIGPATVQGALKAGLSGIAVETGRSLVLDRQELIEAADRAGIFVHGIEPEDVRP